MSCMLPRQQKKKKKKKKKKHNNTPWRRVQGFTLSEGVSQSWRNSLREGQGLTLSEGVSQSWKEYGHPKWRCKNAG